MVAMRILQESYLTAPDGRNNTIRFRPEPSVFTPCSHNTWMECV